MIEASPKRNIVILWISWHFFEAPKNILRAWRNFLVFNFRYFSFSFLLKTLFCHWRRYRCSYGRGFDLKRYFSVFLFNLMSRILGAMVRILTILLGLLVEVFLLMAGIIAFFSWIFLPLLLPLGLYFGLKFLI